MLRCCLCMNWYHFKCVHEDQKSTGIWSCYQCRQLPILVKNLSEQVSTVHGLLKTLSTGDSSSIVDMIKDVKRQMALMISEQQTLQTTNTDLIQKLSVISQEKTDLQLRLAHLEQKESQSVGSNAPTEGNSSKSLLIGNSLLRNISSNSSKLDIKCFSGATYASLTDELSKCNQQYDNITIVTGTTDCRKSESTTSTIRQNAYNLLSEAKKHCESVNFSSILPQIDPDNSGLQLKTDHVNEYLKQICTESTKCSFVDNDCVFRLSDSSQNDALFVNDGIHVNYKGAQKLMQNLHLADQTLVKKPPQRYQQLYRYGASSEPSLRRDTRSQSAPNGYQSAYKCIWCRRTDHVSEECTRRGSRACYSCKSPSHLESYLTISLWMYLIWIVFY